MYISILWLQFIRYEDPQNKPSVSPLVVIMICNCAKKKWKQKKHIANI